MNTEREAITEGEIGRLELVASSRTLKFVSEEKGFKLSNWTPIGQPVLLKPDYNPQGRGSITSDDVLEGEFPDTCDVVGYLILDKDAKEFSEIKAQFYKLKENASVQKYLTRKLR